MRDSVESQSRETNDIDRGEKTMALDYKAMLSLKTEGAETSFGEIDVLLYALGVGMGGDPMNRDELPFVYEKNLKVLPTFATVISPGRGGVQSGTAPAQGSGINFLMVLHGEQRLTVHKPLPANADLYADRRTTHVIDKGAGKGALIVNETVLRSKADGEKLITLSGTIFARADGGFGGPSEGGPIPHEIPSNRAPDKEVSIATRPDQALIYRLSGDRNPLHSDPDIAMAAGFPRPILHGLCSYGVVCRAVVQGYAGYDAALIRQFDVRFAAPVFPGETITTRMWKDGPVISFDAVVKERNITVIKNGKCVLAA
jgi:acyl dehydratase